MMTKMQPPTNQTISQNAYIATTSTFLSIAVIAAAARAFIRIFYLKRINVDDYFFFVAVATLISGEGLFFAYIRNSFEVDTIIEGNTTPPQNFSQQLYDAWTYTLIAKLLCWTTIFSIKLSFLFYFRTLVDRWYKMEVWWWFTFAVLVPTAAISVVGPFIACTHPGAAILKNCSSSPACMRWWRRERGFLYFSVASDVVTDFMLISIPVIVLHTVILNTYRKLSIAIVLCLSVFMVAIALVRGISFGIIGTKNVMWNSFWVQLEASISVITACPIAFRSVFVFNSKAKNSPDRDRGDEALRPTRGHLWRRVSSELPSFNIGATLPGMKTIVGESQLKLEHDDGYELSSTITQSHRSSPSFEASERGAEVVDRPFRTMV